MEYREYFLTALQTAEADTQSAEDLAKETERLKTEMLKKELFKFLELFRVINENYTFGKSKIPFFSYPTKEEDFLNPPTFYLKVLLVCLDVHFNARIKDDFNFEYFLQERTGSKHLYFDDFETFVRFITMRVMEYKTKI